MRLRILTIQLTKRGKIHCGDASRVPGELWVALCCGVLPRAAPVKDTVINGHHLKGAYSVAFRTLDDITCARCRKGRDGNYPDSTDREVVRRLVEGTL